MAFLMLKRWIAVSIVLLLLLCSCNTTGAAQVLRGCRERCGNLTVPYPFGMDGGCYLEDKFKITCSDEYSNGSAKAFLAGDQISVNHISLDDGELSVLKSIDKYCDGMDGNTTSNFSLAQTNFTISATKNKFTAVGCDTLAVIEGYGRGKWSFTSCISLCNEIFDIDYSSCSGHGCCQPSSIPEGLQNFSLFLASPFNNSVTRNISRCSYAFLAEEAQFKFSKTSFQDLEKIEEFPLVLDWTIGNLSCDEAPRMGNLTCKGYSKCHNSQKRSGYLCRCLQGYEGNPYHPDGCQDIDECKDSNPCINGTCHNKLGNFTCSCQKGYKLNGRVCSKEDRSGRAHMGYVIPLSLSLGFITLLVASLMLYWGIKKRKMMKLKAKFFEQNGGFMLQQQLISHGGSVQTTKIFSEKELRSATKNYDRSTILGEGGFGSVYKGILSDNRVVAIKKSKISAQTQNDQFINEITVLLQINHRNVVKLLGCCLETEVPVLVYEFVTNGTLFEHIHHRGQARSTLSWRLRLKIAAEIAGALAYLHSETFMPVIHRDMKTANVLLDENFTAKVSDFGASRLIPLDQEEVTTLVQGTFGYLDPEYMHSSQLTEKSDVYSFGVVLAELITGKKAVSFDRPEADRNLATFFVSSIENESLFQVIDDDIVNDGNLDTVLHVANLAKRCLRVKGEKRPSMKEVSIELDALRTREEHAPGKAELAVAENENLQAGAPSTAFGVDANFESSSTTLTGEYGSSQNNSLPPPNGGR